MAGSRDVSAFATRTDEGWLLAVHVQPGAKRSELAGLHGSALKVRIAAAAMDGRANAALAAFLAQRLGVARSKVQVVRGERAREKLVAITDPQAQIERLFEPISSRGA